MAPAKRSTATDESRASAKRPASESSVMNSPLKRVKAAIQQRVAAQAVREELVLSTVEAFRAHVLTEMTHPIDTDIEVIVTGTLIWKSGHTHGDRIFVRLHLTDTEPTESFDELAEFEDLHGSSDDNRMLVDGALLTATVFDETVESARLPANGSIVRFVKSRNRFVYNGKNCQLVTKVQDISSTVAPSVAQP